MAVVPAAQPDRARARMRLPASVWRAATEVIAALVTSWSGPAPRRPATCGSGERFVQLRLDLVPVHELVEERRHVLGPAILVVDVISMLPDVDAQDRPHAVHQRILAVRRFQHLELNALYRQPSPAGAELGDARGLE